MINQVNNRIQSTTPLLKQSQVMQHQLPKENSFGTVLQNALNKVSEAEQVSDKKTELLAKGKINDLHDVMITAQKANISVEAAVQVQQKVIDTYNEMMRMQI